MNHLQPFREREGWRGGPEHLYYSFLRVEARAAYIKILIVVVLKLWTEKTLQLGNLKRERRNLGFSLENEA